MRKKQLQIAKTETTGEPADLDRELELASERLDKKGRARWLLEFAYLDFSKLSQGARSDISFEVCAFGQTGDHIGDVTLHLAMRAGVLGKLVEDFKEAVRTRFDKAIAGENWVFEYPKIEKRLALFGKTIVRTTILPGSAPLDRLLTVATDLLEKEQEKFGICGNPRCKRPFVSQRNRRIKFCSQKCSAYVRVTAKIERDKQKQRRKKIK